ncbi:MAG: DUF4224 domain-containing protein [Chromatiaceae bacterium]|nr:DUF4224 domain-containing protein [Rhizobiaceae bacterium]MCP5415148.1 DUF4224 domain-containing protein [Chromatiaceae bacterium]
MSGEFLTDDELIEITCYKRRAEQREALQRLGVPFVPNRLGRPLVRRSALDDLFQTRAPRRTTHKVNLVALQGLSNGAKS